MKKSKPKFIKREPESPEVIQRRWDKKKEQIEVLANNIQKLRYNVTLGLKDSDNEKVFLTALVVAIILETSERVGNEASASNDRVGITGLKKKQISIDGNKVTLEYTGKSGVEHIKSFSDEKIAKALKLAIKRSKTDDVFCTSEGFKIKADRILRYLSDFKIRSKDIRSIGCNKLMVDRLKNEEVPEDEKKRKKFFMQSLRKVAIKIGHGSGTLRKHYLIPELETNYIKNGNIIDISERDSYEEGGEIKNELLAPNGKSSNLNKKQYELVRSPEFISWFGNWIEEPEKSSKVIDENGEPLIVFHGSAVKFNIFDNSKIGLNYRESEQSGFFFTQKKRSAENYATLHSNLENKGFIYECFLNIKNPIIRNTDSDYYAPADRYDLSRNDLIIEIRNNKSLDGVIITGTKKDNLYVVLKSNQIKLANGENNTFESSNPDIRFEKGGTLSNIEFKCDYEKYFEYVPLSEIEKYIEFDREIEHKVSKKYLDELTEEIKVNGITYPITLEIYDGKGLIVEGNHRIAVAKRLGIKYIPVRLIERYRPFTGTIYENKVKELPSSSNVTYAKAMYGVQPLDWNNSAAVHGFTKVEPKFENGGEIKNVFKSLVKESKNYNTPIDADFINSKHKKGHVLDNIPKNTELLMVESSLFEKEKKVWGKVSNNKIAYHDRDSGDKYWNKKIDNGAMPPVLLEYDEDNNQLRVRDGNHRLNVYLSKNIKKIPIILTINAKRYLDNEKFSLGGSINRKLTYLGEVGGDKIWQKSSLEKAKSLEKQGISNEEIRQETGWFVNPYDKKWRFEISDEDFDVIQNFSEIKNMFDNDKSLTFVKKNLDEVVRHDKLFAAYPEFKTIPFIFHNDKKDKFVSVCTSKKDKVYIEYNLYDERNRISKSGGVESFRLLRTEKSALRIFDIINEFSRTTTTKDSDRLGNEIYKFRRNILAHELQHVVQIREEFGGGNSPIWWYEELLKRSYINGRPIESFTDSDLHLEAEYFYQNSSGEIESKDVDRRIDFSEEKRKEVIPLSLIKVDGNYVTVDLENPYFEKGGEVNKYDNFKKWFNGSKVVDEFGKPRIVFHGTNRNFNVFDSKEIGQGTGNFGHYGYGFYFSDDIREAKGYGDIILECYLNIKKPFTGTDEEFDLLKEAGFAGIDNKVPLSIDFNDLHEKIKSVDSNAYKFMSIAKENGIDNVWSVYLESNSYPYNHNYKIDLNDLYNILVYTDLFNQNNAVSDYAIEELNSFGIEPKLNYGYQYSQSLHWVTDLGNNSQGFTEFIKSLGYDGVICGSEYVAFYPNQIKLANGINSEFDSNNNDIRFEDGGAIEKITFDNFYKGTKADFKEIMKAGIPKRKPDFISESGSKYWFTANSVIRQSDHWGQLDTCEWTLDGRSGHKMTQGICQINNFSK